ncbi:efflux RND transporter permease subunit [Desulfovibrio sp. JC010]|nr:efflux RND transporter permease subunit [Desulfovibrio sp. JC010]
MIEYFADHPTAANLLMLIFFAVGIFAAPKLLRETFPDFAANQVQVTVIYPGATAETVEEAICQRIEDALDGIIGVEEVTGEAREGKATVTAEMVEGGDFSKFIDDVRSEVDAIDDFPEEAEEPVISELNRTDNVVGIAVSGPMSVPHLKMYAEQLKDRLQRLKLVSLVEIQGFSEHQIRIEIPAAMLMQFRLSMTDITDVIGRQSLDLPSGTIETAQGDILVRFADERKKVHEFEDLVVKSGTTGAEIRLGDIATITDRFELDEDKFMFNGKRAALLLIQKTKDQDALRVLDEVQTFLDREQKMAPPKVTLTLTQNQTEIVRDRLSLLVENGFQGLILVFLAMWLFFDIRMSFWVSMGLPVSFLGGLFVMYISGLTLNMLTMVGLLLAIGLIMDDAIVIAENISTQLQQGKSSLRAAIDGTRGVLAGVTSSFATTLLIFGTLAFMMKGDIGKVLWVMPTVLIMTLAVSLVEAFLILPNHLSHSLAHAPKTESGFRKKFNERFNEFREKHVGRFVDWSIRWRYLYIGLVFSILLASVAMLAGGVLKMEAFPEVEGDILQARLLLPQGTPLEQTEESVEQIVEALKSINKELSPLQPGGKELVESYTAQFNTNADANEAGPHVATITADLLGSEDRNTTMDELKTLWEKKAGPIPDAISLSFKEPSIGPGGLDIEIRLQGDDLKQLKAASHELLAWLTRYEGTRYLMDDLRPGKPEMEVRLKQGATALGLDATQIARQLRSALQGQQAAEIQDGSESYEIDVRLDPKDRNTLGDLDYFHVTTPNGDQIPLGTVAELKEGRGWARIARVDSLRTVTVQGDVDGRVANANAIVADTKTKFLPELIKKYPGVSYSLQGAAKEGDTTGKSMGMALMFGVFGIFVLLSFHFRSYLEPIVVITAIPLAFIGVIWGHLLMGYNLSMPSIMGFVSLAGVVVNDSILLVEFLKQRMKEGMIAEEAASKASRQRFRALLLTSLTTIVGLLPLLFERSLQAQILIPLTCSLVFGMLTSTILVLSVVPALYTILDDLGLTEGARLRKAAEKA